MFYRNGLEFEACLGMTPLKWLSLPISGYLLLYLAITDHFWLSYAISGYLRLSQDILSASPPLPISGKKRRKMDQRSVIWVL